MYIDYNTFLKITSIQEKLYIKQIEAGFLPTNFCDIIKDMYSTICLHFLENEEVFSKKRQTAVQNIINSLSNG